MITASSGVQTDLSKVVHSSCRSIFLSSVQQIPLYISPVPDQHAWDIDALNINWFESHCLCLPSHGSPSQGDPKTQAKQLPHYSNSPRLVRDALGLGPSAALNRYPTPLTSVNNTSETVPQPSVSQHLNLHT